MINSITSLAPMTIEVANQLMKGQIKTDHVDLGCLSVEDQPASNLFLKRVRPVTPTHTQYDQPDPTRIPFNLSQSSLTCRSLAQPISFKVF